MKKSTWLVRSCWFLIPGGLGFLVLVLTGLFRRTTSETFDETIYLWLGYGVHRRGNMINMASPMCPPLPILLEYPGAAWTAQAEPGSPAWYAEGPRLIERARLTTSLVIGVPLVIVVAAWLGRRRGWVVGALGGLMLALSPSVLAASSVATTDACFALFAILALGSIRIYRERPGWGSYTVMGVALGFAVAAKQTGAILFPVALVFGLARWPQTFPGSTRIDRWLRAGWSIGSRMAGLVGLAFLVDWSLYGFGLAPKVGNASSHASLPRFLLDLAGFFPEPDRVLAEAGRIRLPLAIDTFVGQMQHASLGHPAFLMGQTSTTGWWYFFPVALAIKSTPAELTLFGLSLFEAFRRLRRREASRLLWLSTILILLAAGMGSAINIGHRYMLLCYPLVVLTGFDTIGERIAAGSRRAIVVGVWLVAWQASSLAGIAPHYLAYFNSFVGGPSQGYRYLVDSSLDWGQDLPGLRNFLERRKYRKVALFYFGLAQPSSYGINSVDWMAEGDSIESECDYLAISATGIQATYGAVVDMAPFRALPAIQIGYSLFVFDLRSEKTRAAWLAARAQFKPEAALWRVSPETRAR